MSADSETGSFVLDQGLYIPRREMLKRSGLLVAGTALAPRALHAAAPQTLSPCAFTPVQQNTDELIKADVDSPSLTPLVGSSLATVLNQMQADPRFNMIRNAMGLVPDPQLGVACDLVMPPSSAGTMPTTVRGAFIPFVGQDPNTITNPFVPGSPEFLDGILLTQDQAHGVNELLGIRLTTGPGNVITSADGYYLHCGSLAHIQMVANNFMNSSLAGPFLFNNMPAQVQFALNAAVPLNLIPAKFRKANGNFVGAKRAGCLAAACLAIRLGCGWLARIAVCAGVGAEVAAACAPLGPGAAACAAAAGVLCAMIIGKICRLIAAQLGITAQAICDNLGIGEAVC